MPSPNQDGDAQASAGEYVRQMLTLLGDDDPLEVQARLVPAVEALLVGLDEAAFRRPEQPGEWTIAQLLQHLADAELIYGYRMRRVVAQPGSVIEADDQDAWAKELNYDRIDVRAALEQLRVLREMNLRWLRSLSAEALERAGLHSERGPESVRRMTELVAGHDRLHLQQMENARRGVRP